MRHIFSSGVGLQLGLHRVWLENIGFQSGQVMPISLHSARSLHWFSFENRTTFVTTQSARTRQQDDIHSNARQTDDQTNTRLFFFVLVDLFFVLSEIHSSGFLLYKLIRRFMAHRV